MQIQAKIYWLVQVYDKTVKVFMDQENRGQQLHLNFPLVVSLGMHCGVIIYV